MRRSRRPAEREACSSRAAWPTWVLLLLAIFPVVLSSTAHGWSNGGFSTDPANPDYGTHDWIAHHALDWLPQHEKQHVLDNLSPYLYATELPDNGQASDGIGDTFLHHVYYHTDRSLQDDAAASRAQVYYQQAVAALRAGDLVGAARASGIMTHYLDDVAVFGHVMGSGTDWGAEHHHSDYEDYVNERTNSYTDEFNLFLTYDGSLETVSAYDATLALALDTTFDLSGGGLTAVWMDTNYDWSNPTFRNRAGASINLAVNLVADALHAVYVSTSQAQQPGHVVINEVEQNPPGTDAGYESVELYNPSANAVDVSGWTLSTIAGVTVSVTLAQGSVIGPFGFVIYVHPSQWLDNEAESVVLSDPAANVVDATPMLYDTYNDDYSWQRYPNGQDTDSVEDWVFQPSTSGYSNGGQPPVLSPIGDRTVDEETSLVFTAHATDPDGGLLSFSLGPGRPSGASITLRGDFSWQPSEEQGPGSYPITVIVSDGEQSDLETITVAVSEVNRPPVLTVPAEFLNFILAESDTLTLGFTATDPDIPANVVTLSASGLADRMSFDQATGTLTFAPAAVDGGKTFTVSLTATDNGVPPHTDTKTLNIRVGQRPTLTAIPDTTTAPAGDPVTLEITASDPDGTVARVMVDWGDGTVETFNGSTSTATHSYRGPGTYTVTVTATDDSGLSTATTSTLTVSQPSLLGGPVLGAVGVGLAAALASFGLVTYRRRARKQARAAQA